jgi:ankyrin repeat protein
MTTSADAFDAIVNGDLDALTAALDAGTDPNAIQDDEWTLLMEAVGQNRLHMVDMLLSRGANVHQKHRYGCTALHVAASRNNVFRTIFSAAGPRAMNFWSFFGWTPLHCLANNGSEEQMAFALSHPGIDVSIRIKDGRSLWPNHRSALKKYGDQEARWQPMRFAWIKLLMIPTRR